jgi:hypothetical protein
MSRLPEVRQQMFKLIQEWQQSGFSQKAYCKEQSIKYHVFHYWYKRYRQEEGVAIGPGADNNKSSFPSLAQASSCAI